MVAHGDLASVPSKSDRSSLPQLLAARSRLTASLGQISQLQGKLSVSERHLQALVLRLPALQSIMAPLQTRASLTNSLTSRIDGALERASCVLAIFKAIHAMEKNLNGDPKADLRKYLALVCCLERYLKMLQDAYGPSLDWLEEVIVYLTQCRALDQYSLHKLTDALAESRRSDPQSDLQKINGGLLDKALRKLEDEFGRLVVCSSSPMDLSRYATQESDARPSSPTLPFSRDIVAQLLVITDRLKVNGRVQECLRLYKEVRVRTVRKGMASLAPIYLQQSTQETIDKLKWEEIHEYIYSWLQHVRIVVNVLMSKERELCDDVFARFDPSDREKCFGDIVEQSKFSLFFQFAELVARSQQRPEALLIGLLDLFKGFEKVKEDARGVFEGLQIWGSFTALERPLVQNVVRAFRELVKNVETCKTQVPKDGGKDLNVSFVVNYMGMIVRDYGEVLEEALELQHGWKEGGTQLSSVAAAALSIMNAVERNLEDRARAYDDPVLAHVYLMNNYRHVVLRLKECVGLAQCLGEDWVKDKKVKMDQNMRSYRKKAWEGLITQHLSREGLQMSSGSSRELLKSRVKAFSAALEEAYNKQCKWVVLDPQLRDSVRLSVIQLVVPAYQSFVQSFGSLLQEIGSRRLIRYSPETLEVMLGDLFEGRAASAERNPKP